MAEGCRYDVTESGCKMADEMITIFSRLSFPRVIKSDFESKFKSDLLT